MLHFGGWAALPLGRLFRSEPRSGEHDGECLAHRHVGGQRLYEQPTGRPLVDNLELGSNPIMFQTSGAITNRYIVILTHWGTRWEACQQERLARPFPVGSRPK